jgi:hypothetical protein
LKENISSLSTRTIIVNDPIHILAHERMKGVRMR